MPDPIDITFTALARMQAVDVEDALLATLERPFPEIRSRAVDLLITSAKPGPLSRLIEHYCELTDAERDRVRTPSRALLLTLDHCLKNGSDRARAGAVEAITEGLIGELLPAIVQETVASGDDGGRLAATMETLSDALADHIRSGSRPDAQTRMIRQAAVESLAEAARGVEPYRATPFLRCLFALSRGGDPTAAEFLSRAAGEIRDVAFDLLERETHPQVIAFLLDLIRRGYMQPRVVDIFRRRRDTPFVAAWLRSNARGRTTADVGVLREIGPLSWLTDEFEVIDDLPDDAQACVAAFADHVGLTEQTLRRLRRHLLEQGSVAARESVEDDLRSVGKAEARELLLTAITNDDDAVAVWGVDQLHQRDVADAGTVLLELLDSDRRVVREAARRHLSGFGIERLLEFREKVPTETLRRAVALGRKIDPELTDKLHHMLTAARRRERVRLASAVGPMGLTDELIRPLRQMLGDKDAGLRRVAVEAFAWGRSEAAGAALELALSDRSPLVRSAAEDASHRFEEGKDEAFPVVAQESAL
ncbi:MAG: hypothetical protein AAF532_16360 [Planctomycetota bacterium]